jgi:hypothetical protein
MMSKIAATFVLGVLAGMTGLWLALVAILRLPDPKPEDQNL